MAKRGGFSIGVDYGRNEILAAKALSVKHSVNNIAFAQMEITPENASLLPKVDMVICLSIFHHWIRKLGEADSLKIMRGSRARQINILCLIQVSQMKKMLNGINVSSL